MEVNRQESISIRTPRRRSPPACSTAFVPFVFSTTMCTRLLTRGCPSAPSWTTTILRLLTSPSMPSISSFVIAYGALISITATTFPLTTSSISGFPPKAQPYKTPVDIQMLEGREAEESVKRVDKV